ncbi:hypothetical protein CHS0354_000601 [Potamilus streckersoni]|uniref:DUF389 domain-containing protein n=1 Tax=Potamilus streckersoni TaxID=2493646 RepID=A0AAE0W933_9BIVA|nr:hypothetical protein CHS0354_000601 [Potamilus streckersoni]
MIERKIYDFINLKKGEEQKEKVLQNIKSNISFRGANLWILACAIVIASVGLNVNSTAVIIGAMLISPLMGPIVGAGFALAIYDFDLLKRSSKNLLIATVVSLIVATLYFYLSPFKEAHSELLARTSPNIYDVLIAFFGGVVGVIAITRVEKGNPIPGVAIATALMPPLCTAGYGLSTVIEIKQDSKDLKSEILNELSNQNKTELNEYKISNIEMLKEIAILFPELSNVSLGKHQINMYTDSVKRFGKRGGAVFKSIFLLSQNLKSEMLDLYGHRFICLNPNRPDKDTQQQIRDWLDLIYRSIHSPERSVLNIDDKGIRKVAELISFENLTPEGRTNVKNKKASRVTVAKIQNRKALENTKKVILKGYDGKTISDLTDLTIGQIRKTA